MVRFRTLDVSNVGNLVAVLRETDKACGYACGPQEADQLKQVEHNSPYDDVVDAQELYVNAEE